jgi:hypothetical protein
MCSYRLTQINPAVDKPFNRVQRLWKPTRDYYLNPWGVYKEFIHILKDRGAQFLTMSQVLDQGYDPEKINVLLDHHIDHYPLEMEAMCQWELENDVVSSIYLFNKVVNPATAQQKLWTIEDLDIAFYQELEKAGFEIGYHQNAVGQALIEFGVRPNYQLALDEKVTQRAKEIMIEDVSKLKEYFDIRTMIPHGGGEANAFLIDTPEELADVTWVYNNNTRSGTCEVPIQWENYSDSSGQRAQVVKGFGAHYVIHRSHLYFKANLMGKGLHHILLHPGRFSKNMPYRKFRCRSREILAVSYSFETPSRPEQLPLSLPKELGHWSSKCEKNEGFDKSIFASKVAGRYTLLTDDVQELRTHMAANEDCVPNLLRHSKLSPKIKKELKVDKRSSRLDQSYSVQLDSNLPVSAETANRLFENQFSAFFNTSYINDIWRHLSAISFNYDVVVIRHGVITKLNQLEALKSVLQSMNDDGSSIDMTIQININSNNVLERLQRTFIDFLSKDIITSLPRKVTKVRDLNYKSNFEVVIHEVHSGECYELRIKKFSDSPYVSEVIPAVVDAQSGLQVEDWFLIDSHFRIPPGFRGYLLFSKAVQWGGVAEKLETMHEVGLPTSVLEQIAIHQEDFKNYRHAKRAYGWLVNHQPSPDLLLEYCADRMSNILIRADKDTENAAQTYAWPWAYAAQSAAIAYSKTNDEKFFDLVAKYFETILTKRDSVTGRVDDLRARVVNSWGTSFYGEYAKRKGYESAPEGDNEVWTCGVTAAARILNPFLMCLIHEQSLNGVLGSKSQALLSQAEAVIVEFEENFSIVDGNGSILRIDRGKEEPLNHQNTVGLSYLYLHRLTKNKKYLEKVTALATYFERNVSFDGNGSLIWGYYGFNGPEGRESQKIEDVAHGHLNLHFLVECYKANIVFERIHIDAVCKTLMDNIYQDHSQLIGGLSPRRRVTGLKANYPEHIACWILLADFNPEIKRMTENIVSTRFDLFPDNWFTGSATAIAYAHRL